MATPILDPGEELSDWSEEGRTIVYSVRNGTTWDLARLDRATGSVRRLTDNDVNETSAVITPDGKTPVYERWRNVRRIAIVDLSGVAGATTAAR